MAQIEEVPGAISQGRTRPEACENVIDALRLMLKPETPPDRRPQPRAALSPAGILKRRALERHLRGHGAEVLDQGAKHTKWRGPTGVALHRARHNEIAPGVAVAICEQLGVPTPPNPR